MENRTDISNKMNMISFTPRGIIHFDGRIITLSHMAYRRINTFILHDNCLYVCTYISKYMMKSCPKEKIKDNNVMKFDAEGNLLFKTGLLRLKRAFFGERKFVVSGLSIENGQLHLEYDSIGYEAWADMETGKIVRGQYVKGRQK